MNTAKILGNSFMSESTVKLLNNPYGQVTFNLFRQEEQAFVDKKYVYESADFEDKGHGFCIYIPCRTAVVLKKID